MAKPLVSIVIPALNAGVHLGHTLEALLQSSYSEAFEVIVVDNGSEDDTVNIAQRYGVKLVSVHPKNRAVARNSGVKASSGKIVGFLDSDCRPERNWIEESIKALSKDVSAVQGWIVPAGGAHVSYSEAPSLHQGIPYLDTKGFLIWRADFEEVGGFDESLLRCEDIDFGWKLSTGGKKLVFIDSTGVSFGMPVGVSHSIRRGIDTGKALASLYLKWDLKLKISPWHFLAGVKRLASQNQKRRSKYLSIPITKRLLFLIDDIFAGICLFSIYPLAIVNRSIKNYLGERKVSE